MFSSKKKAAAEKKAAKQAEHNRLNAAIKQLDKIYAQQKDYAEFLHNQKGCLWSEAWYAAEKMFPYPVI